MKKVLQQYNIPREDRENHNLGSDMGWRHRYRPPRTVKIQIYSPSRMLVKIQIYSPPRNFEERCAPPPTNTFSSY